ncbi:YkyA family protein [Filibacter tadaridae]|uniref:Cell-wall binding lipoprotein n=1 Tax=Filibacter tadaridae TaxID=2483811 RepID=A0A3P5X6G1_9BACL|nr:YkyA family protein [Filibacter tadaridae]VDC29899.1 Putative cell-wall binding lipoprotein [Filibacter tadaridae]
MKKCVMGLALSVSLILSGCSFGSTTEKQLSDALNNMNSAEKQYRSEQSKLVELEKSEQQLFDEVMKLTQEQKEELGKKVSELDELLLERISHLEKEEESMATARKAVEDFNPIIEKAEDAEKKRIEELKKVVSNRYELHSAFVEEYEKLTELQKELYDMLIAEGTELPDLKELVARVNTQNEKVQAAITEFNEATGTVNDKKDELFASLEEAE